MRLNIVLLEAITTDKMGSRADLTALMRKLQTCGQFEDTGREPAHAAAAMFMWLAGNWFTVES